MNSRDRNENSLLTVVEGALRRWLERARQVVMAPWSRYRMQPNPVDIFMTQPMWNNEVDTILTRIGLISLDAWSQASDVPPVSRHSFVMSQLAQTQNFLVRIPDEVYQMIFAELTDGTNAGESLEQLAARVDALLSFSDNWRGRARNIAITENTRAYGAGTLAAGMEQSRVTGKLLNKRWHTEQDRRVRLSHEATNGQTIPLGSAFRVGESYILFPGDPTGAPEEVIGCRCDLVIVD